MNPWTSEFIAFLSWEKLYRLVVFACRAHAIQTDFLGPSEPATESHGLDTSNQGISTPLMGELYFSELYNGMMNQMDRQRDVLVQMKRKYVVISCPCTVATLAPMSWYNGLPLCRVIRWQVYVSFCRI